MTANEVLDIIKKELGGTALQRNPHGLTQGDILPEPCEEDYLSFDGSRTFRYWTVVEERPDRSGYTVYFDPDQRAFGLGSRTEKGVVDIGTYGSFIEAFQGM